MTRLCRVLLILAALCMAYCAALLFVRYSPVSILALVGLLGALGARRLQRRLTACGTARWADEDDLKGMLERQGLIIGRADPGRPLPWRAVAHLFNPRVRSTRACDQLMDVIFRRKRNGPLVRLTRAVHSAVFAPTGVGKGVSLVIPFLQTCPDSIVVIDFKGENARLTAEHRRKVFGHRVVILDPFKVVTQHPDTFNPLDWIDKDAPFAIDESRALAEAMVIKTGQEKEPHWNESAEVILHALISLVVCLDDADDRSLQMVRNILCIPGHFEKAASLLAASSGWDGMLARLGAQLMNYKNKELDSTLTTTNRFLRFLDTLAISASTRQSSFDPNDLRQGRTTIYLVLPPEHIRTQSPLLRLWITSLMRAVVRGGLQEQNKIHFILDEAASLGHMDILDDAVDKFRAYGIRLQFYYQSLGQLRKCWPEGGDQTLLSNTTQVFFGVNDPPTAEYVSTRLGEATIVVASGGTSTGLSLQYSDREPGVSRSTSWNNNDNWQQSARKLLKPEEVMALNPRLAVTFTPEVPPILTRLVRHYEEDLCGRPSIWQRIGAAACLLLVSFLLLAFSILTAGGLTLAFMIADDMARARVSGFRSRWEVFHVDGQ